MVGPGSDEHPPDWTGWLAGSDRESIPRPAQVCSVVWFDW